MEENKTIEVKTKSFKLVNEQSKLVDDLFNSEEFKDLTQSEILVKLIAHFKETSRQENEEVLQIDTTQEQKEIAGYLRKIEGVLGNVIIKATEAVTSADDSFREQLEVAYARIGELEAERDLTTSQLKALQVLSDEKEKVSNKLKTEIEDLRLTNKNLNDQINLYKTIQADKEKLEKEITELKEVEVQNKLLDNTIQNLRESLSKAEQEKAKFIELMSERKPNNQVNETTK